MRDQLKKMSARIVLGRAFEGSRESYSRLRSEEDDRRRELVSFEEDFLASQEVGETVRTAVSLLKRRKVIFLKRGEITINTKRAALLEFYSNSLSQLLA
jgi:hypothetical protein